MTYLLAKYTLLFLLTAAFGFVLGYWWSRRNFVDVSESYADLRKASQRSDAEHWERLWQRLDKMPRPKETDLSGVEEQLQSVATLITNQPKPEPISFAAIENRLDALKQSVSSLPKPPEPRDPDFRPVTERLDRLDADIKAIRIPDAPPAVDLAPLDRRLNRLDADIKAIRIPDAPPAVDLAPLDRRLDRLDSDIKAIRIPDAPPAVDLGPLDQRLTAIETELSRLRQRLAEPEPRPRERRESTPRILKAALYGKKDDLKRISGVGPKLEKLLNENGVYYFWQVASWSSEDISTMDERLDVFRGRINRDKWVRQANKLEKEPGAASKPA